MVAGSFSEIAVRMPVQMAEGQGVCCSCFALPGRGRVAADDRTMASPTASDLAELKALTSTSDWPDKGEALLVLSEYFDWSAPGASASQEKWRHSPSPWWATIPGWRDTNDL